MTTRGGSNSKTSCLGSRVRRVPGARATTVHSDVWDHCFALVGKNRSSLSRFFYATLSSCASVEKAPDWKIWPMPLPFPEVFRRKANRRQPDIGRKLGVNFLVLILNWLHWGGRGDFPFGSVGLGTKLNAKQWSVARRFADWVDLWNKHSEVDATAMGRSAAKVESIEDVLRSLGNAVQCWGGDFGGYSGGSPPAGEQLGSRYGHPGVSVGTLASSVDSLAKEVEPDRFQFHGVPSFDPVPFLDDNNRLKLRGLRGLSILLVLQKIWWFPFPLLGLDVERRIK